MHKNDMAYSQAALKRGSMRTEKKNTVKLYKLSNKDFIPPNSDFIRSLTCP